MSWNMSERIRVSAIMQQLDVSMLSVEIFFQMSSFNCWWEPSYMKSTDDETWGGGVEWGNDDIYTLCKSLCDLTRSASKCAQGTAQKLVKCELNKWTVWRRTSHCEWCTGWERVRLIPCLSVCRPDFERNKTMPPIHLSTTAQRYMNRWGIFHYGLVS